MELVHSQLKYSLFPAHSGGGQDAVNTLPSHIPGVSCGIAEAPYCRSAKMPSCHQDTHRLIERPREKQDKKWKTEDREGQKKIWTVLFHQQGYDDRENDLFLCDTNTCKFDGECLRIGDSVTCVCQFKCNNDYVPVCGSNGDTYQNECYLKQAACKQQSEILLVSEGSCATDAGSGSGDGVNEGSGETNQKETSTCDICQFGAECDEDAEDVWCVCNIDCSQTNFNPLCASDGKSYDNACQIKEASCQKQEKIEVMSLGRCQDNTTTTTKSEDGHYARTDYAENANKLEESARGIYIPCPEHYNGFCMHGKCEHSTNMLEPSCRCDAGYTGQHCEKKDYSVLYVVPGPVRFQYVLIAAVIGTIQIAIICVVVLCITRKCPRSNRIHRQKQNTGHYSSDNTTRASTRLI
nr:PREDICTED: tomoregulin-2 [Apteryx mantelli mantelli]